MGWFWVGHECWRTNKLQLRLSLPPHKQDWSAFLCHSCGPYSAMTPECLRGTFFFFRAISGCCACSPTLIQFPPHLVLIRFFFLARGLARDFFPKNFLVTFFRRFFKHIALDLLDNIVTMNWKSKANSKRKEFEALHRTTDAITTKKQSTKNDKIGSKFGLPSTEQLLSSSGCKFRKQSGSIYLFQNYLCYRGSFFDLFADVWTTKIKISKFLKIHFLKYFLTHG